MEFVCSSSYFDENDMMIYNGRVVRDGSRYLAFLQSYKCFSLNRTPEDVHIFSCLREAEVFVLKFVYRHLYESKK